MTTSGNALFPGMSEARAIEGSKLGDGECFQFLYKLHKKRVYSLCLRMMGDVGSAEDLTQETFLELYRKIAGFRGESAFATWLHRLTVNVVLMRLRRPRPQEVSLEATLEPTEENDLKKDFGSPDLNLAGSIDRVILEGAMESLPPAIELFSCCTTSRAISTTKLPRCSDVRLATANRSFTKRGYIYAIY